MTGVQTCALPICAVPAAHWLPCTLCHPLFSAQLILLFYPPPRADVKAHKRRKIIHAEIYPPKITDSFPNGSMSRIVFHVNRTFLNFTWKKICRDGISSEKRPLNSTFFDKFRQELTQFDWTVYILCKYRFDRNTRICKNIHVKLQKTCFTWRTALKPISPYAKRGLPY